MFWAMIFALVILFAGSTVLDHWLRENPLLFLGYWAGCALLTFLAFSLAAFDLLQLRVMARRERRNLEAKYLTEIEPPQTHGENPPGTRAD